MKRNFKNNTRKASVSNSPKENSEVSSKSEMLMKNWKENYDFLIKEIENDKKIKKSQTKILLKPNLNHE